MNIHSGNKCPVDPNTAVRVQYRDNAQIVEASTWLPARLFSWVQHGASSDIVKYEVKIK